MKSSVLPLNILNGKTIRCQRGAEKRSENGGRRGRKRLAQLLAFTHSDITTDEFNKRVASWIDTHKDAAVWLPV